MPSASWRASSWSWLATKTDGCSRPVNAPIAVAFRSEIGNWLAPVRKLTVRSTEYDPYYGIDLGHPAAPIEQAVHGQYMLHHQARRMVSSRASERRFLNRDRFSRWMNLPIVAPSAFSGIERRCSILPHPQPDIVFNFAHFERVARRLAHLQATRSLCTSEGSGIARCLVQ